VAASAYHRGMMYNAEYVRRDGDRLVVIDRSNSEHPSFIEAMVVAKAVFTPFKLRGAQGVIVYENGGPEVGRWFETDDA